MFESLKCRPCRLRPQFHLMCVEEMEARTITWGVPELLLQHQHSSPGSRKEVARTWADIWSTKLMCLAEGSLRKHKMAFACAVHKPEFSMLNFKGHSGICDKAEKTITISGFALRNPCVFCLIRPSAYLLFSYIGEHKRFYLHSYTSRPCNNP